MKYPESVSDANFTKLPGVAQIKDCIRRTQILLEREFVKNDTGSGWYHFLGEGRIGILGTAAGIMTMAQINPRSNFVFDSANYLVQEQICSKDKIQDGGWGIVSIGNIAICESTTWCTLALCEAGLGKDKNTVGRAISWLISNQNDDGGWGAAKPYTSRTYSTSMAIQSIGKSPVFQEAGIVQNAAEWLLSSQNSDGGWGEIKGSKSTPIHTAHAILGLIAAGIPPVNKVVIKAISWLYSQTDKWDQPFYETYEILKADGKSNPRVRIDHTVLPWVITALVSAGESINQLHLKLALSKVVFGQDLNGYWRSGTNERISIFELQDNIIALSTVLKHAPSLELTLDIQERLTLLENEVNKFLPAFVYLSGILRLYQRIKAFLEKFYWLLVPPLFLSVYALLNFYVIRIENRKDFVLYGLSISTSLAILFAPYLKTVEKIAYTMVIVLGSLSIVLFNYRLPETVASVLFTVAVSIAFYVLDKYRKK